MKRRSGTDRDDTRQGIRIDGFDAVEQAQITQLAAEWRCSPDQVIEQLVRQRLQRLANEIIGTERPLPTKEVH